MNTIYWFNRNSVNRPPSFSHLLIPLMLACFALSPMRGLSTRLRTEVIPGITLPKAMRPSSASQPTALISASITPRSANKHSTLIQIGNDNTAIGLTALYNNIDGGENTATGRWRAFG